VAAFTADFEAGEQALERLHVHAQVGRERAGEHVLDRLEHELVEPRRAFEEGREIEAVHTGRLELQRHQAHRCRSIVVGSVGDAPRPGVGRLAPIAPARPAACFRCNADSSAMTSSSTRPKRRMTT
jgi:hypothetical protein